MAASVCGLFNRCAGLDCPLKFMNRMLFLFIKLKKVAIFTDVFLTRIRVRFKKAKNYNFHRKIKHFFF